ncbi:receptor activity-modifying protein 3 isoform X1 [Melospiza melodia melodia]
MRAPSPAVARRRCRPRRDGGAGQPPAAPPRPAALGPPHWSKLKSLLALRDWCFTLFHRWLVNGLMTLGFAGARQQSELCNESLMLEKLPACGKSFEEMMKRVDSKKWCNLTEFIMYYDNFTQCTEREANNASCFWPNPLAEGFITGIHKQFFSNCTSEKVHWEDPPDEILITLILIPVLLTCAMITLVVWCSKRSDILV